MRYKGPSVEAEARSCRQARCKVEVEAGYLGRAGARIKLLEVSWRGF